jgi:hypothetical protein
MKVGNAQTPSYRLKGSDTINPKKWKDQMAHQSNGSLRGAWRITPSSVTLKRRTLSRGDCDGRRHTTMFWCWGATKSRAIANVPKCRVGGFDRKTVSEIRALL